MIKIDLNKWENALIPINTLNVNKVECEQLLYNKLITDYGFSKEEIQDYVDGKKNDITHLVNYLEEKVILENGGKYYD